MRLRDTTEIYGEPIKAREDGARVASLTLDQLTTINEFSDTIEGVDARDGDDLASGFKHYRHALFSDYDEEGLRQLRSALDVGFEEDTKGIRRSPDSHWLIDEVSKQRLVELMISYTEQGLSCAQMTAELARERERESTVLEAINTNSYTPQANGATHSRLQFSAAVAKRKVSLLGKAQQSFAG